jgi:hypothetical protein
MSKRYAEFRQVSEMIEAICTEEKEDNEDPAEELTYLKRFFRKLYCGDLSASLRDNIELSFFD